MSVSLIGLVTGSPARAAGDPYRPSNERIQKLGVRATLTDHCDLRGVPESSRVRFTSSHVRLPSHTVAVSVAVSFIFMCVEVPFWDLSTSVRGCCLTPSASHTPCRLHPCISPRKAEGRPVAFCVHLDLGGVHRVHHHATARYHARCRGV